MSRAHVESGASKGQADVEGPRTDASAEHGIYFDNDNRRPLICLGFMFDESVVYMSDVSSIPESTWARMLNRRRPDTTGGRKAVGQVDGDGLQGGHHAAAMAAVNGTAGLKGSVVVPPTPQDTPKRGHTPEPPEHGLSALTLAQNGTNATAHASNGTSAGSPPAESGASQIPDQPQLPILVIDALWPIARHPSHTNFIEALDIALRLKPAITYVIDVVHPVTHFMWEELCLSIRGLDGQRTGHPDDLQAADLIKRWWADEQVSGRGTDMGERVKAWAGRVEPGWDGLVVRVHEGKWTEVGGKKGSTRGWTQAAA